MRSLPILPCAVALVLFACGQTEPDPNAIVELSESELPPEMPSSLTSTSWRLLGYDSYESGQERETPAAGETHLITFEPDGNLVVKLACNDGRGRWQAAQRERDRGSLDIDITELTKTVCPGARMTRMVENLEYVASYGMPANGQLVLHLRADSGNLVWERVE